MKKFKEEFINELKNSISLNWNSAHECYKKSNSEIHYQTYVNLVKENFVKNGSVKMIITDSGLTLFKLDSA